MIKIKTIYQFILDLIIPAKCVICDEEGSFLCQKCFHKILKIKTPFCPECKRITPNGNYCRNCRRKYQLSGIISAAHYDKILKKIIYAYKYDGVRELAKPLSRILIERLNGNFPRGRIALTAIPLHIFRQNERGFNQAELIAEKIASEFDLSYFQLLKRKINTKSQIDFAAIDRRKNLIGAFEIAKNHGKIQDRTILLLDDVATTGTTLNEAAKVLKKAGAKNVWGLTVAK
jgi:ComF family protein